MCPGAGIHTEADADAGMRPGAGIRSESGPDAGTVLFSCPYNL